MEEGVGIAGGDNLDACKYLGVGNDRWIELVPGSGLLSKRRLVIFTGGSPSSMGFKRFRKDRR